MNTLLNAKRIFSSLEDHWKQLPIPAPETLDEVLYEHWEGEDTYDALAGISFDQVDIYSIALVNSAPLTYLRNNEALYYYTGAYMYGSFLAKR